MKVGDLVRVKYDGTVGIIARVEVCNAVRTGRRNPWVYLHTGEEFRSERLEVINASR